MPRCVYALDFLKLLKAWASFAEKPHPYIKTAPQNTSRGRQNIRFSGYAEHQPE